MDLTYILKDRKPFDVRLQLRARQAEYMSRPTKGGLWDLGYQEQVEMPVARKFVLTVASWILQSTHWGHIYVTGP